VQRVILPPRAKHQLATLKYIRCRSHQAHDIINPKYIRNLYRIYFCDTGRYANRIIMPVFDLAGNIVSFTNRATDDERTKSLHAKGIEIGNYAYGLFEAQTKRKCVLVEGQFDLYQVVSVIKLIPMLHDFGVVALLGTALPIIRKELLASMFEEIFVMLDHNNEALERSEEIAWELDQDVEVKNVTDKYPKGKDPGVCTIAEIKKALLSESKEETFLDELRESVGWNC
jgi:DNA primase (bacterial type)